MTHPFIQAFHSGCPYKHNRSPAQYEAWKAAVQIMCDEVGVSIVPAGTITRPELISSRQTVLRLVDAGVDVDRICATYFLCFGEMPDYD